jgi:hypothetical protein
MLNEVQANIISTGTNEALMLIIVSRFFADTDYLPCVTKHRDNVSKTATIYLFNIFD